MTQEYSLSLTRAEFDLVVEDKLEELPAERVMVGIYWYSKLAGLIGHIEGAADMIQKTKLIEEGDIIALANRSLWPLGVLALLVGECGYGGEFCSQIVSRDRLADKIGLRFQEPD